MPANRLAARLHQEKSWDGRLVDTLKWWPTLGGWSDRFKGTKLDDICAHLGLIKGNRVVIGFALEDHDHHARAEDKLRRKRCDAIVLGGIGNIAGDNAEIEIFTADGGWSPPRVGTKAEIASVLVDLVEDLVGGRG